MTSDKYMYLAILLQVMILSKLNEPLLTQIINKLFISPMTPMLKEKAVKHKSMFSVTTRTLSNKDKAEIRLYIKE